MCEVIFNDSCYNVQVGDQIIEINGYNTNNMTHAEAIDLIQNGGSTVRMLVKRTGKPPPHISKLLDVVPQVVNSYFYLSSSVLCSC